MRGASSARAPILEAPVPEEINLPSVRPAHIITRAAVPLWPADSVVKTVTYHRTSATAARRIVECGVEIGMSRIGSYGQGFYTANEVDPFYGDVVLTVAIRMRNPLRAHALDLGDSINSVARRFRPRDSGLTPAGAAAVRRELLDLGYDGIVVIDGEGDGVDAVIGIEDGTVKVVID